MIRRPLDFARINMAALPALPALCARWLPGGKRVGREYIALNPTRADKRAGSFKVNLQTGRWADFATGDKGSDAVSLAAYLFGLRQSEAAHRLAGTLGIAGGTRDDKEFWPLTLWRNAQGLKWRWKSVPALRPLYRLDLLAARPDATVVVCEGEKSADAGVQIFPKSVAVTSPGGANAADKADWSVLRGRKVLIWPDADKPGRDYAAKVGATLATLDCDVSIIDAGTLARTAPDGGTRVLSKEGWDAADASSEWPDLVALRLAARNCAQPLEVPAYVSFGDFTMSDAGLCRETTRGRGGNAETVTLRVSAPFEIVGRGRDPDGRAWGRFLCWRDPDGRRHEKFVADEMLHGDASALCAPLAAEGLEIVREEQRAFASYLSGANPAGRVTVVERTGWHMIEGENVFVLPGECIGPKRAGRVWFDRAAHGQYAVALSAR